MNWHVRWAAMAALLVAVPAFAQDTGTSFVQKLLDAARLPTATKEARGLGVPENDLQGLFRTARDNRISAGDLADLLSTENEEIRRHGPIDNFGAFVQGRLAAGLRGRELAAAIHAEHGQRAMDQRGHVNQGMPGANPGSMNTPGNAAGHGGKPESPGKSAENGKKGDK